MNLKPEDKDWLRAEIKAAVEDALTVEMDWIKVRDPETGVPLATPERIKEKVFLPSFFCQHMKFHEGAWRGNQETLDNVKNRVAGMAAKVDKLGDAFIMIEDPMVTLTRFVGLLARTGIMDRLEEIATIDLMGPETKKIASGG